MLSKPSLVTRDSKVGAASIHPPHLNDNHFNWASYRLSALTKLLIQTLDLKYLQNKTF
jgi:hypothetical protein